MAPQRGAILTQIAERQRLIAPKVAIDSVAEVPDRLRIEITRFDWRTRTQPLTLHRPLGINPILGSQFGNSMRRESNTRPGWRADRD